jgi:hypothetical protein
MLARSPFALGELVLCRGFDLVKGGTPASHLLDGLHDRLMARSSRESERRRRVPSVEWVQHAPSASS